MEKNKAPQSGQLLHTVAEAANKDVAFEHSDVHVTPIAYIGAALLATILIALFVVWLALKALDHREVHRQEMISPLRAGRPEQLPPEPRLQGAPGHAMLGPQELQQIQDQANGELNSYGWVDQPSGVAKVPIQQAMDMLVARGLPAVPKTPPASSRTGRSAARAPGTKPVATSAGKATP